MRTLREIRRIITVCCMNVNGLRRTKNDENLVKNTFDHTERRNLIQIDWKQSASIVQIVVEDNSSGIHPEQLHHIFKRFYRSRFLKDKQIIGLGLPFTKMIAKAHNGMIKGDSKVGDGTIFFLNFFNSYTIVR